MRHRFRVWAGLASLLPKLVQLDPDCGVEFVVGEYRVGRDFHLVSFCPRQQLPSASIQNLSLIRTGLFMGGSLTAGWVIGGFMCDFRVPVSNTDK